MKFRTSLVLISSVVALVGCGEPDSANQQASSVGVAAPPPPGPAPVVAEPVVAEPVVVEPATDNPPAVTETPADVSAPVVDENTEAVTAEVGFGKKGHYDSNDYISVAVGTKFRVQERLTLMNIQKAMQLYKAQHQGYPKTHEEYWKEIIEAGSITLPELKNGEIYHYDPDLAEETDGVDSLQILRPKNQ